MAEIRGLFIAMRYSKVLQYGKLSTQNVMLDLAVNACGDKRSSLFFRKCNFEKEGFIKFFGWSIKLRGRRENWLHQKEENVCVCVCVRTRIKV